MLIYQYADIAHVAKSCRPGAKALMAWILDQVDGAVSLGCLNNAVIPGSTTLSIHAEGRAIDPGTANDAQRAAMIVAIEALVAHCEPLGIQCVIHQKKIWSISVDKKPLPFSAWRELTNWKNVGDHFNHAHLELTRERAEDLSYEEIEATVNPPAPVTEVHDVEVRIIVPVLGDPGARDSKGWPICPTAWARFVGLYDGKVVHSMWWLDDEATRVEYEALGYFDPLRILFLDPASFRNITLTSPVPTGDQEFEKAKGRPWSAADYRHVAA